jgi:HAE1 family hydrophobic/amphiphilic exporter-1
MAHRLAGTDLVLQNIEREAWKLRGVRHVLTTINGGGSFGVTDGNVYLSLVDITERKYSQFDVMDDARQMMKEKFPGLRLSVQPTQNVSGGNFRTQSMVLNVRGPGLTNWRSTPARILKMMQTVPGMVDQDTTLNIGNPEIHVALDRAKAADLGVRAEDVASTLRTLIAGEEVSKFKDGEDQYSVQMRLAHEDRDRPAKIETLWVPSEPPWAGAASPALRNSKRNLGPAEIERMGRERQVNAGCESRKWRRHWRCLRPRWTRNLPLWI